LKSFEKETTTGVATFLVKMIAHQGESANEETNIQTDKAISSNDVPTEWQTGQIKQSSHGKSIVRKQVGRVMKIESRGGRAGCKRRLEDD